MSERRAACREAHLAWANKYVNSAKLYLGGAFGASVEGGLLIFKVENQREVEAFVTGDPYVVNGLVVQWRIEAWSVVVGTALRESALPGRC